MKRAVIILLLLLTTFFASGFSIKDWKKSLYDQIKVQAESSFSGIFQRKVSIQSAGGTIVGQIKLNGVVIPGLGQASQVILNFNPLSFITHKGDILPALTKITVIDGEIKVHRDKKGILNLSSLLPKENAPTSPPPAFREVIVLKNCRIDYVDQAVFSRQNQEFKAALTEINGKVSLKKKNKVGFDLKAKLQDKVAAKGNIDTAKLTYQLKFKADKLVLERIAPFFPQLKTIPVKGDAAVDFTLRGTVTNPEIKGKVSIANGSISGQKFNLASNFSFEDQLFSANLGFSKCYRGNSNVEVNFNASTSFLELKADFSQIDLARLAQSSPGIEGQASGAIELRGPLNNLAGEISSSLSNTLALGQPLSKFSSTFKITNGDFSLEKFSASSDRGFVSANGKIDHNLYFDLATEAQGLRLSGKGPLGKMGATVNHFKGEVGGRLDRYFLASPLKELFASGEVSLSSGQIGEQTFDEAKGGIEIGGGNIAVREVLIRKGSSLLRAEGNVGIGAPTNLKLHGIGLNLEHFKILNNFLPLEAKDPRGLASFEVELTGTLPSKTTFTSLDPLLQLNISGEVNAHHVIMADMPELEAFLRFDWQNGSIVSSSSHIKMPDSYLFLNLNASREGTLSGSLKGIFNLAHLQTLLRNYGKPGGIFAINMLFSGEASQPNVSASFRVDKFYFNSLSFDSISGALNYNQDKLAFLTPLVLKDGKNLYGANGSLTLSRESFGESNLDITVSILKADLADAYLLFEKARGEVSRLFSTTGEGPDITINTKNLILPSIEDPSKNRTSILYSTNNKGNYLLKKWQAVSLVPKKGAPVAVRQNIGGDLSGELLLIGEWQNPHGRFKAQIDKGRLWDYSFDQFSSHGQIKKDGARIERASLSKGNGTLSLLGNYNFDGVFSFSSSADEMPLDALKIFFPGKEFAGLFNLNGSFYGSPKHLKMDLAAGASGARVAGINFDKISLQASKRDDALYLHNLSLSQGDLSSTVSGEIRPDNISLEAEFTGDAIGLLNLFNDQVFWKSGKADLSVTVRGDPGKPAINGAVEITDSMLYIPSLSSDIRNLTGQATIKNNRLSINNLDGYWTGDRTGGVSNPLGLSGIINLSKIFKAKKEIDINLAFKPTHLYANFPDLFTGNIYVDELSLAGPLSLDFSLAPKLTGKARVDNSLLTLSQQKNASKNPPLSLDLEVDLNKNVYAAMGNIATLDLSNIFMNLEITGEKFKIMGDLNSPSLSGKILLKRGTINIFSREFSLLSGEQQKKYFPYNSEKVKENQAVFSGPKEEASAIPELNLVSAVNVENSEKDSGGKYVKKQVTILADLKGIPGDPRQERGLKISLSSFTEDKTKSPVEILPAAYSEQDLKVMLLPDFIKSLAGLGGSGETTSVDSNVVVADYLSSHMQAFLFRSIERQAEQKLGLESLTLEYNLGPKVKEALGVKDPKGYVDDKPAWTVGFAKAIAGQLYLDMRYAQGMSQAAGSAASTSFNYQLTYKLSPIWSIIYYREPMTLTEFATGYQKITLKAGFSLW